jgi:hypothetical protein
MTDDAVTTLAGYGLAYLGFFLLLAGCFIAAVRHYKRNPPTDIYEPYGDATDTPQMRLNTRRVNFYREDV